MLTYIVRRLFATLIVMAIVALFVFSLLYIAPGDPAAVIAGDQASPEDVEKIRTALGLDRPFLVRFTEWSWQIVRYQNLGTSMFTGLARDRAHRPAHRADSVAGRFSPSSSPSSSPCRWAFSPHGRQAAGSTAS